MKDLPLLTHIVELRNRLVLCVGVLVAAFIGCYVYAQDIYSFLVAPLAHALAAKGGAHQMIYTQLTEAFVTYIGVALWSAFFVTSPFIMIQIWRFMAPGLYSHERKLFMPYLFATPLLFIAGAALAYYVVFPAAWAFFLSFETPAGPGGLPIQLEPRVGEYLGLAMSLIMAFGFSFELPLVLVLLVHVGLITTKQLIQFRRYAIVISFTAAAIFTPPDVMSQLCLAIPLCLLYEAAILASGVVEKARLARLKAEEAMPS